MSTSHMYSHPISGNRERKIDYLIAESKRRLSENNPLDDKEENEDEG